MKIPVNKKWLKLITEICKDAPKKHLFMCDIFVTCIVMAVLSHKLVIQTIGVYVTRQNSIQVKIL